MKASKRFTIIAMTLLLSCSFASCTNDQEKRQKEISQMATEINSNPTMLSTEKAEKMISLYSSYVKDYPQDTMCEYYLFQMHNVYSAMKNCDSALYCLDRIIKEYPNGKNVGAAYFFKGVVLNDVCANKEKSVEAFEEYIRRYPNNSHVEVAKKMIQMDTMKNPLDLIKQQDTNTIE